MSFLLYKHPDDGVFDDFPKISDYFPKISEDFPKLFRRPDERSRRFSEDFRRLSKIAEDDIVYFFVVYFLLYDNCIVNLYISYLDLVVVGPRQLYSCSS